MGAALILAGSVLKAGSDVKQGRDIAKASRRQGRLLAEAARERREQGVQQAEISRQQTRRILAANRAAAGASGLTVGTGSFLLSQVFSQKEGEKKQEAILAAAESDVRGLLGKRRTVRKSGRAAQQTGIIQAGGSLIGGLGASFDAAARAGQQTFLGFETGFKPGT